MFKMFLIFASIGMYELISQSNTPVTISTRIIVKRGIIINLVAKIQSWCHIIILFQYLLSTIAMAVNLGKYLPIMGNGQLI